MTLTDISGLAGKIREIARAETAIFSHPEAMACTAKANNCDVVTKADLAIEKQLTPVLQDHLQGSVVIGEEDATQTPALLHNPPTQGYVWYVDPVDGTGNFANKRPVFGTIVALVKDGEAVASFLYSPLADVMITAEKGAGCTIGSRKITIDKRNRDVSSMAGIMAGGLRVGDHVGGDMAKFVQPRVAAVEMQACSIHDYLCLLLKGYDFYECHRPLKPWDHVAGALAYTEAGGFVQLLDGTPYHPVYTNGELLCAANEDNWNALATVFKTACKQTDFTQLKGDFGLTDIGQIDYDD